MNAALTVASWLDLAATVTLAGGLAWARAVAAPSDAGRRALRRAVVALAVALALEFGVTAIRMHEVAEIGGVALVIDLLGARWGRLWLARLVGLAVFAVVVQRGRPGTATVLLAVPWLFLRSYQGHAGAHGLVPAVIDAIHLIAASTWIGGLVQLRLHAGPVQAATALRFRTIATVSVALLVPAGVYAAFLHVPSVEKLIRSPYGRTLLAKLVMAAFLLALGGRNHFRHVPDLAAGTPGAAATFDRTVRHELALAAAVLLASALLGVLPMPHPMP